VRRSLRLCRADLAGQAPQADRALWTLALAPKQSLPFLKEHLRPVVPAPADRAGKLIADLGSDKFAIRENASQALESLGAAAEGQLRKSLENNLTLEVRQRIQQIVDKRDRDIVRETVRYLLAIEALEQIGTPEALETLEAFAKGTPSPRLAEGARAAIQRLSKRRT
jgi:hypothetical protein